MLKITSKSAAWFNNPPAGSEDAAKKKRDQGLSGIFGPGSIQTPTTVAPKPTRLMEWGFDTSYAFRDALEKGMTNIAGIREYIEFMSGGAFFDIGTVTLPNGTSATVRLQSEEDRIGVYINYGLISILPDSKPIDEIDQAVRKFLFRKS